MNPRRFTEDGFDIEETKAALQKAVKGTFRSWTNEDWQRLDKSVLASVAPNEPGVPLEVAEDVVRIQRKLDEATESPSREWKKEDWAKLGVKL